WCGTMSVADLTEQLAQTEQLVVQLKGLIREKDQELRLKDQQLKEEKESSESKVSKAKLQNKAKIASLTSQLEELKKQVASPKKQDKKSEHGKASGDGEQESASANRGKILLLKRRVEELESQLSLKNEELKQKDGQLELQRQRGSEMDIMLAEKEKKLSEKEAYIVELQVSAGKNLSVQTQKDSANQDLQSLIQNLTRKVGESEERCSLLQEQTESLKSLLNKEKNSFQEKEAMYAENIRVYQNMILEKEKSMKEQSEKHDQELFKLAAKSDASADLHQLLKALKQKLHEEEEVLLGKNQVIDVLQKELDNKDQHLTEINEKCKRLQSEKENLQSKLDAEKHVMRAQLKDMMDKHGTEMRRLTDKHSAEVQEIQEKHEVEIQEKCQTVYHLQKTDVPKNENFRNHEKSIQKPNEVKLKTEEASKSEAKFLKLKAWSKSKIRQLEEELKILETKNRDLDLLKTQVSELEGSKKELEAKLESVGQLQSVNEQLLAKLEIYEEQQRKLQADLEQVTKRADSQTSESGSVDELQTQMLEWQEMNTETERIPDQDPEEKSVLAMRMVQIEEEREGDFSYFLPNDDWFFPGCSDPAMDSGQQELEEELSTARGMGKLRQARRKGSRGTAKLQDEYDYATKSFEDENLTHDSIDSTEGENMGGLRAVVEELELERNQLQEQIMVLEERCQELEDKLQLQARIETLQNENERLQTLLGQSRHQQSRESEKHQDLMSALNEQLKGLTERNLFLESSIEEKERTLKERTSRLEHMKQIENALHEKELLIRELREKLEHSEQQVGLFYLRILISFPLRFQVSKQDSCIEKLQLDLDQTNEELDRLNTSHLDERSQLIHDLQRCERDMDILKEVIQEKDKEMLSLSASLTEYTEQISILKDQMHFKEEQLREMADALVKAERESHILRESQSSDMQETSAKISSLSERLNEVNEELTNAKSFIGSKSKEAEVLIRQINESDLTIKNLRAEIQAQSVTHSNHVMECSSQIASLKEQQNTFAAKLDESEIKYRKEIEALKSQWEKDVSEREKISGLLEEKSNKEKSFENELKLAKEQYNKLVSGISEKDDEIKRLSREAGEQKAQCDQLCQELQAREEHLCSLQQTSENVLQDNKEKVKGLQEKIQDFQKQLDKKSKLVSKLEEEKSELHSKTTVLGTTLTEKEHSLAAQAVLAEEQRRKVEELEEGNQRLQRQLDDVVESLHQKESEALSLNQALLDLQNKMTQTEMLLTEERAAVSKLTVDKDELLAKVESISAQRVQKDNMAAAQYEEKAKECLSVKEQLTKEQEMSQSVLTRMRSLENELTEAQKSVQEKDKALQGKLSEFNAVCGNLAESQEKNTQLSKQVEELSQDVERQSQVLHEKESLIKTQHMEAQEVKISLENLKGEEHKLREEYVNVTKQVEELNAALHRLQQEVVQKTEENALLGKTIENSIKEVEKLHLEKTDATLALSTHKVQCDSLQSQVDQSQSAANALKQELETLRVENGKIRSDLESANVALANKSEEVNLLSSHLSQQGHKIMSLNDELDAIRTEKQTLLKNVEERDALLHQKEELIKQRLEGEGHYLQQVSTLQNELQSVVSERSQLKLKTEEQETHLKRLVQEAKLCKDKSEEADLLRSQLSEHMVVISDLHSQLQNLRGDVQELNGKLAEKDVSLKEKDDRCSSLKTQISEVENLLEAQKRQVENLISENHQHKSDLSKRDEALKNSASACEDLQLQLQNKEEQCQTLMQQVGSVADINKNQTMELNELKTLIRETEASVKSQLEVKSVLVSNLQGSVSELSNKLKGLEQSTADKEHSMQNLQEKYASLHEHKSALEQSLTNNEEEIAELHKCSDEKDVLLQAAGKNIEALTKEADFLREELERSAANFKNISDALKEKEESVSQNQSSVQLLQKGLESLNAEYEKSLARLQEVTLEKGQKELLIVNLQETCNSQAQHMEKLKADVEELKSKVLQLQQNVALEKEQLQQQHQSSKCSFEKELQALQEDKTSSLDLLQKQLAEKDQLVQDLEDTFARRAQDAEAQMHSAALLLKNENADLRMQVSGYNEEVCALKGTIEALEGNLAELQQQSESINEQKISLGNQLQSKERALQVLLTDLHFVEEQLSVLCNETFSENPAVDCENDCISKLEKLSPMLCVAANYKSKVAELHEELVAKDLEIDQKSHLLQSFERERDLLREDLQKVEGVSSVKDSLMEELAAATDVSYRQQCVLQEKEERLKELSVHIAELQKEVDLSKDELQKRLVTLHEESRKVQELIESGKGKDSTIKMLHTQLNQQKALITTVSDQMKEKDASLTQVMESMSNEMLRFSAEKNRLHLEVQSLQSSSSERLLKIQELSESLEACRAELEQTQNTLATKEGVLSTLAKEKDHQVEKLNKEKENLKRKLQAALVVRKDLMQRIEKLEKGRDDEISSEQLKRAELEKTVEELSCQLESLQNKIIELQGAISQKESAYEEYSNILKEKDLYIAEIKDSFAEKVKTLEEEKKTLLEKLESPLGRTQISVESHVENQAAPYIKENDPALQHHADINEENQNVDSSVHVSLSSSTEIIEAVKKGDHSTDPEVLQSQVEGFERFKTEHTNLQNFYEAKCKENEQNIAQIHSLQLQSRALEEELLERSTQLSDKELKLEDQRRKLEDLSKELEKVAQCEQLISELKKTLHDKDDELLELNSQHAYLLRESQTMKDELQKVSSELAGKQEETEHMKHALGQLDQYKMHKETLAREVAQLQDKTEASRTEVERLGLVIQKLRAENDEHLEASKANQAEIDKMKHDLELASIALLDKDNSFSALQDSFEAYTKTSKKEIDLLHGKLKESHEVSIQLQVALDEVREDRTEKLISLEKANAELSHLKTTTRDSCKEEATLIRQSNAQKGGDYMHGFPDTITGEENLQSGDGHIKPVCDSCSRNQSLVFELERKILEVNKEMADMTKTQEQRFAEECGAKDQIQRKLQAALISRKDLLKENKALKEKVNSLGLEMDELKCSIAETHENKISEWSSLSQKYNELFSEKERLLSVNENLSAACESLKSTMESIVEEKEAFSYQLNSLKDSQMAELSAWKAKHGELNKEYESLLQAYENISDEIEKMRKVIEMTKKEKHEVLHRLHVMQAENHELEKQVQEANDKTVKLRAELNSAEYDVQRLQTALDGPGNLQKSGAEVQHELDDLSLQNQKLNEANQELQENYESVKLSLENKDTEIQTTYVKKTMLDSLMAELDTYKTDTEIKFSELFSDKEILNDRVSELTRELVEKEQSLDNVSKERLKLLEQLNSIELASKQEKNLILQLESNINHLHLEKMNLGEKVKILEDDKALLQEEFENLKEQYFKVKNERENLETELLKAANNNGHLSEKFKSLQVQTNLLSQQVECLRAEKTNMTRAKEEHHLQLLRGLEERVKCARDDNRGTKTKSKELQELLKEKQQEINHLQKDSIRFQELLLDLEESLKESNKSLGDLKKELANASLKLETSSNETVSLKEQLSTKEHLLQSALDQIASLAEHLSPRGPQLGDRNYDLTSGQEIRKEVAVLTGTANGEPNTSFDVKEDERINGQVDERNLFNKRKHTNDVNIGRESNWEINRPQASVEARPHDLAISQSVGSAKELANELKTVQNKLIQREKDLEQVLSEQDKLKASLEKQMTISKHMKGILDNKDAEISVLISSKDGEISNYLSQVQCQYRKQVEDYEHQLSSFQGEKETSDREYQRVEKELKWLQGEYEKAINDKALISSEIEAFRKSMSSLQTDRDLLCSELKDMHHHHEVLLNQKDSIIISTAEENNCLKQELRTALNQLDDLNAQNAMLGAQLVRYRQDLNQVLSMKDHQLKELLRQKLDHIKNLEQEICDLQKQNRELQSNNSLLKQNVDEIEVENQKLNSKVRDQETLIAEINKDKIFFEYGKKNQLDLQNGSDSQAKGMYDKEAIPLEPNTNQTKGGTSSKSYWDIYKENKELKSQNESFGKAMATLQNNRDTLIEDFKVLQWRYAGELKAEKIRGDDLERQQGDFKSHIYSILKKNAFLDKAFLASESKMTCDQLIDEIETVCSRLNGNISEVSRLTSECTKYTKQIDAFSKAMASLQHDRERLLHQLRIGSLVRDVKQTTASSKVPPNVEETEYFTMDLSQSQTDTVTQVRFVVRYFHF
uniref:Golgin subfamily B member 1 n=1 Tax=Leptobrachium leishanense TaxID=445787 RepID=A0A8C5WCB0_9ANUR